MTGSCPKQHPVDNPIEVPFAELVGWLRGNLGDRLVVYLAGWAKPSTITCWVDGESAPAEPVQARLRQAFDIAALLRERYDSATVERWFSAENPRLDGKSPAQVLREAGAKVNARAVREAAESFTAPG